MSILNRRAIQFGGIKNKKNKHKIIVPPKSIFDTDDNQIVLTIDPSKKAKETKVSKVIGKQLADKHNINYLEKMRVIDLKYGNKEQMEKERIKKIKEETKKNIEAVKKTFQDKINKNKERANIGMGKFLQDLNFSMKYYQKIEKEFRAFEEKFFVPDDGKNKYNIFRFKLNDNIKSIAKDKTIWEKLNKLSPNDEYIKHSLLIDFKQLVNDLPRRIPGFINLGHKFNTVAFKQSYSMSVKEKSQGPLAFYVCQLALFYSYYYYKHLDINHHYYDFKRQPLIGIINKVSKNIYNAVQNNHTVNYDFIKKNIKKEKEELNIKRAQLTKQLENSKESENNKKKIKSKLADVKMRIEQVNKKQGFFNQDDITNFIMAIVATANDKDKKYNIIDGTALFIHIFFKNKIGKLFKFVGHGMDKLYTLKITCKFFTFAHFIDPYLFTEYDEFINKWHLNKIDKKLPKDKKALEQWKYPIYRNVRLGEVFINRTNKYDKNNPNALWLDAEQRKYNIFNKEKEETIEDRLKKNQLQKPINKHHEAFLHVYKEKSHSQIIIEPATQQPKDGPSIKTFIDQNDEMYYKTAMVEWIMMQWSHHHCGFNLMNSFNTNNNNVRHFMKCIYQYGIDGFLIYNLIHFKNMRTCINLNNKSPITTMQTEKDSYLQDLKNHKMLRDENITINGKKHNLRHPSKKQDILNLDDIIQIQNQMFQTTDGELFSHGPGLNVNIKYDFTKTMKENLNAFDINDKAMLEFGLPRDFYWHTFINPLTCNIEETYGKHFDYCIEQINKQHGNLKKFNDKFDKLFSDSLILYKNGYMQDSRLKEITKKHPNITIVEKLIDIWEKHKNDKRIFFNKSSHTDVDTLKKSDKGWIGSLYSNQLQHAIDGVYHIHFESFIHKSSKFLKTFVPLDLGKGGISDCKKTKLLWPKNSGRPFIFVNKCLFKMDYSNMFQDKIDKKFYKVEEVQKKILKVGLTNNCFSGFWFDTQYPFTNKDQINHIQLKLLFDRGFDKYKSIMEEVNNKKIDVAIDSIKPEEKEEKEESKIDSLTKRTETQKDNVENTRDQLQILENKIDKIGEDNPDVDETKDDVIHESSKDSEKEPEKESEQQDPKKAEAEKQLKEIYNLKIDKIEPNGDCLFEAFNRFLKSQNPPIKVPGVQDIRIEIASHVQINWERLGPFVDTELYKDSEDYFKKMTASGSDKNAPRARFGSELEMKAFEEIYQSKIEGIKVQVLKWNTEQDKLIEIGLGGRDFKKDKIKKSNTLTIYNTGDLHYEYLVPYTPVNQGGGGNNVYINKCKNHRHKKTRKFRIKFKNVGDWVHLNKPKKRTRRRY